MSLHNIKLVRFMGTFLFVSIKSSHKDTGNLIGKNKKVPVNLISLIAKIVYYQTSNFHR